VIARLLGSSAARLLGVFLACMVVVPLGAAFAQGARTFTVRADNDAFDFWMLPWNRPDEEYTSGVHLTYEGGGAPRWARPVLRGYAPCGGTVGRCANSRWELGQDIYTPSVSPDDPRAAPGARPNAGWLYLTQAARVLSPSTFDELALTLGVTGPPSLGRFTQQLAHRAAPAFNRPTDWSQQIGFEPGAIVSYEARRRASLGDGADLTPYASASLGNIVTRAEGGFDLRIGWHLTAPWLPSTKGLAFGITTGASGRAIARDAFLDGNTFHASPRVGHEALVGSGRAGVELRYRAFSAAFVAHNDTRSYAAGPKWHPWSSLIGSVTLD
jgi:lipid A 3-O-deacylase